MEQNKRHKHADLIIAWANGVEIQYQYLIGKWFDTKTPTWREDIKYRIKPKLEYIPFEWEDREQLRGKWVKHKNSDYEAQITGLNMYYNNKLIVILSNVETSVIGIELLEMYTFLDGTPCGKLK